MSREEEGLGAEGVRTSSKKERGWKKSGEGVVYDAPSCSYSNGER